MSDADRFYGDFLKELGVLGEFLKNRQSGPDQAAPKDPSKPGMAGGADGLPTAATPPSHKAVTAQRARRIPLNAFDPDVRRLLEAVAFFSTRTKRLAVEGLQRAVDRVNAGHFEFLLQPLPAMTMVRAVVTAPASSAGLTLARGTGLRVTTPTHAVGFFSTTRELRVWPLSATTLPPVARSGGGSRLILEVKVAGPGGAPGTAPVSGVDQLAFHINYMQDYTRSRRIAGLLGQGIRVRVAFQPRLSGDTQVPRGAVDCEAHVGPPRSLDAPEQDDVDHPLQRIRSFFHLPSQDLFLNVVLPPAPDSWKVAVFYVDLDQNWPADLDVTHDAFQLFVVPAVNLRRAHATPIVCDGTKESYPIRGTNPAALGSGQDKRGEETWLHSVMGVYMLTARGLSPLQSALLASGEWTYEILAEGRDPDKLRYRLLLQCPSALTKPETISVDAQWYQPDFDDFASGKLTVAFQTRTIDGVSLGLARSLRPHRPSPLFGNPFELLHLLGLRTQTLLGLDQIMSLMTALGLDESCAHAPAIDLVAGIIAREAADAGPRSDGVKFVYEVAVRPYPPEQQDVVDDFREQLHALLDAWLPGPVEVRMTPISSERVQLPEGDVPT